MKNFKKILMAVALLSIGLMDARSGGVSSTTPNRANAPALQPQSQPESRYTETFTPKKVIVPNTCISGSVLPVYTKNNQKYAILTREGRGSSQAKGGKLFTYDDFSGQCEEEDLYDSLKSAAREFHEEANLKQSLGWSLNTTIEYVKKNATDIIVYEKPADKNIPGSRAIKNSTYIIKFDKHVNKLFDNFYTSLEKERAYYKKHPEISVGKQVTTEKDVIAAVLWDDLRDAIRYHKIISIVHPVTVKALVKDPKTKTFKSETITLRPFLAIKLRSYFQNLPYETSATDNRIHYYNK